MLVDDDEGINYIHKRVLSRLEVANHIQVCVDGQDALEYICRTDKYHGDEDQFPSPDLIFLDINMPRMNGVEFLEAFHKLPVQQKTSRVVVMVTTALLEEKQKTVESYSEVTAFLSKPFIEEHLMEVIETHTAEE